MTVVPSPVCSSWNDIVFYNVILSVTPSCNVGIKWVLAWFMSFSRGFQLTCQSNRAIISLSHRITQPMTRSGWQTGEKAFQFRTPSRCWLSMNKCQPPTKLTHTMPPGLWEAWYFCVWFLAACCFTHGFGRTETIGGERRTTIATRSSVSWKTEGFGGSRGRFQVKERQAIRVYWQIFQKNLMMIFDTNAISINHCAQRRHSLHPKLISPISRFAITAKMIRQYTSRRFALTALKQILAAKLLANTFSQLTESTAFNISTWNEFFFTRKWDILS